MRSLALALATLVILAMPVGAQLSPNRPPTETLNADTAFTLNRGEWRVGTLNLYFSFPDVGTPFSLNQLKWLNVAYGLTHRLQLGTTVLENVLQGPNAWAKFNALRTRQLALAMPLEIDIDLDPFVAGVGSGLAISWTPSPPTSLHAGLGFWAADGQVQLSRLHAALEYAPFAHTHLFVEADVWPLVVEIGSLSRYRAFNLEVSSRLVEDAKPHLGLAFELFVRF